MSGPVPPTNVTWIPGPPCFDPLCPISYPHYHDAKVMWESVAEGEERDTEAKSG